MDAAARKRRQRERAGRPAPGCAARTRTGSCGLPAGWWTDHPGVARYRWHGGASPTGRKAAAREQAMQEVAAADRKLQCVEAGDVLDLALAVANHRLETVQERYGLQLDAGDLALVSVEGETVDRAARIAKLFIDPNLDWRRARIADEQARTIATAMGSALNAAFPDATMEDRARFVDAVAESLTALEPQPCLSDSHSLVSVRERRRQARLDAPTAPPRAPGRCARPLAFAAGGRRLRADRDRREVTVIARWCGASVACVTRARALARRRRPPGRCVVEFRSVSQQK
jgi:hypothetical protein